MVWKEKKVNSTKTNVCCLLRGFLENDLIILSLVFGEIISLARLMPFNWVLRLYRYHRVCGGKNGLPRSGTITYTIRDVMIEQVTFPGIWEIGFPGKTDVCDVSNALRSSIQRQPYTVLTTFVVNGFD